MKKLIAAVLIVAAGGAAAFGAWHYGLLEVPTGTTTAGSSLNDHVPADTLFYAGGLEPVPYRETMEAFSAEMTTLSEEDMAELRSELTDEDMTDGVRLLVGLFFELSDLGFPEAMSSLGIGDELEYATYGIGLAPVYRMSVDNPEQFTATLDRVEGEMDIAPLDVTREGSYAIRRYELIPANENSEAIPLAIGVSEEQVVAYLDSADLGGEELVSLATGQSMPDDSLADSDRLESMVERHGFLPYGMGYLSFEEMVSAFVNPEGNRASRALDRAMIEDPELAEQLTEMRSEACRTDYTGLAADWPGISMGYTELSLDSRPSMAMDMVIDIRDQQTLEGLQSLRGHIPSHLLSDDPELLIGAALGINADALPGFVRESWQRFTQADFTCPTLVEAQNEMRQQNPAMMGPAMSFAEGLKGISITVLDVVLPEQPEGKAGAGFTPESADAVVGVHADDPQGLISMAAAMVPAVAQIDIPDDGSAVALELPGFWQDLKPKVSRHEKHLTLFAGEAGEQLAGELGSESLLVNGLFALVMDYEIYDRIPDFGEASDEGMDEMFDQLGEQDMMLRYLLDVSDNGLKVQMWVRKTGE